MHRPLHRPVKMAAHGRRVAFLIALVPLFASFNEVAVAEQAQFDNVNQGLRGALKNLQPDEFQGQQIKPQLPQQGNFQQGFQQGNNQQGGYQGFKQAGDGVMGGIPKEPNYRPNPKFGAAIKNAIPGVMLAETKECKNDIESICSPKLRKNNFAILECLQNEVEGDEVEDPKDISLECQNLVWQYKRNLTKDDRFDSAASEVCVAEFQNTKECHELEAGQGKRIPCLIENMNEDFSRNCLRFLRKMGTIIFSDYHFIWHFMEDCQEDINKLQCGRLQGGQPDPQDTQDPQEQEHHNQGETIDCLGMKLNKLSTKCRKQVLYVKELQSDDYHMDRGLYYACREDRDKLCEKVQAGNGKVLECLFKKKKDINMSDQCRAMLTYRQRLMASDVKIDKTFFSSCRKDIARNQCFSQPGLKEDEQFRRAAVHLCLESALKADETSVSSKCVAEMNEQRRALMSDYQISPEIVLSCANEIKQLCDGGIHRNGETLHCLMKYSNPRKGDPDQKHSPVSDECRASLEDLLEEADVGSDVTVDTILAEACSPVIELSCKTAGKTSAAMMDCLMSHLDTEHMTDDCEERLLEVKYFTVRDFKLDTGLYKGCHKEAVTYCHASEDWHMKGNGPDNSRLIFPCLYRHLKAEQEGDEEQLLSRECQMQMKKVMRQRARRVDLDPRIEDNCLLDLADKCSGMQQSYGKGEEIKCLQDNYEDLSDDCQDAVGNFTEDADRDINIDTILMRACTPMIKRFCEDELKADNDASKVMDCLISHKNHPDMNRKCAAGVEHHQLTSMKDFSFSFKFKEACKGSVMKYCRDKKKKSEVITCLSELVRYDTLTEEKHRVDGVCRQQLRAELFQRDESINLDPKLKKACEMDIKKYCPAVQAGNAKVIECLKEHQPELGNECHVLLFRRERADANVGVDYTLSTVCKSMIKLYCSNNDVDSDVMDCLKSHRNEGGFDPRCRAFVVRRQIQETYDYRLNPSLTKACSMDIPKFCKHVVQEKADQELEGKVIACLKKQFLAKMLSHDCYEEIKGLVKEVQRNYEMDPILMKMCTREMRTHCKEEYQQHESNPSKLEFAPGVQGGVVECLKDKLVKRIIDPSSACGKEVARLASEGRVDIHIDQVLSDGCRDDLIRFCHDIEVGEGKKMSCLLSACEDFPTKIQPKCLNLVNQRKALWEYAAKPAPAESFSDLGDQITSSPSKTYFLAVLISVIAVIFIVGMTCGRVTKRVTAQQKNK